ncbi:MAG: leucine-rich repeat protein [Clostridia bacterium]|nr:leucine-rich repeat protein [Clostridia bacterium]MBO5092001.1 leucine-rich repeat protein [Clostridia bacterium]MBP3494683.1 leucine-rich repeat protein [Clostridia bacterium]
MKKVLKSTIIILTIILSLCFVACGSKVEFKVNFIVDGEIYSTINTNGNEVVSIPQNPTKNGYTFDGWFWDEGTWKRPFTANSLLNEPLSSDMSVYAKWTEINVEPEELNTDISSSVLEVSGEKATATVPNATTTFSFLNDIKVSDGASYILANDIECKNVIASKTVALEEGDNTYYLLVTNGNAQKLYTITIRRRPIYTVEFNTNGGTKVETLHIEEDSTIEMQQTSKTGYSFNYWSVNNSQIEFPYQVKKDEIVVANWSVISYTIEYELNNGTNNDENVSNYTIEQTVELKNPTRDYYRFDGWYESENLEGASVSKIARGTTGNKTFYAKWTPIQYEIEYKLNGGTNNESTVFSYNTEQETTLKNPTRAGYAFLGWFTNENFEDSAVEKIVLGSGGNKKFYAKWQACENKLVFDGNGSTSGSMIDMIIDTDEMKTLSNNTFEKAGYTFKGWSTTANGSVEFVDGASYTMGTNRTYTLYAVWEANNNTLVFDANGGIGSMFDVVIATDTSTNLTSNIFTREGYTFAGWSTAANGSVEFLDGASYTMGTNSTYTLYAVWEINKYKIEYILNNGINSVDNVTEFTILDLPVKLNSPTREYAEFTGWYTESNYTTKILEINELKNITVYAEWTGLEFTEYDTYVAVTGYYGNMVTINIPEMYNGKPVTTIEEKAFDDLDATRFLSIVIPSTITTIEDSTFLYTENLVEIYNLSNLNIAIGYGNTDYGRVGEHAKIIHTSLNESSIVTYIDDFVFIELNSKHYLASYLGKDENAILPENYDGESYSIYKYAFQRNNFQSVTIPYMVEEIGIYAFRFNSNLKQVTLSEGLKAIGYNAFAHCENLETIKIPSTVVRMGSDAFEGCDNLITVKDKIQYVDTWVVGCEDGVENAIVSEGTLGIAQNSFKNCITLKSVKVPNSVTSICSSAFYDATNLESIELGENVAYMGEYVFGNCKNFKIYCGAPEKPAEWDYYWNNGASGYFIFWGYAGEKGVTESGLEWASTKEGIVIYALNNAIKCLEIPEQIDGKPVVGIYEKAFQNNTSLASVKLSNTITFIGEYAFAYCSNLKTITDGNGLQVIGDYAFRDCALLETMLVPNSTQTVGYSAFYGCISLIYNNYDNACYIGNDENPYLILMKAKDTDITSCEIHEKTKFIYDSAFNGCSAIVSITVPDSVISIGNSAFYECSNLSNVELSKNLIKIGGSAFYSCFYLKNVIIPKSVEAVGYNAFFVGSGPIYCEAESKPSGWNSNWYLGNPSIVWGYKTN